MRPLILDLLFNDDRMFVLELSPTESRSGNEPPKKEWAVVTRRNVAGYPPWRCDSFPTREEALAYYKKVVVQTPMASLGNKPLDPEPSLEEYQKWLVSKKYFDPILNPEAPKSA